MAKRVLSEEEIVKERLAYLGTMAGGLAHELRSPLNSIHLNIELLERSGCEAQGEKDVERFNKRVTRIKHEVTSLQKILTEYLQFARPPGVKRLATDVRDYLYDVVEFIEPELDNTSVRVKLEVTEHDYPVLLDRRQMEQVLQNLIFNARDAMDEGGTITIRTSEDDNDIRIELEDTGPGIPLEDQDRIFEAFFTTKKTGTGLGLGISRRIVQEHSGLLLMESPIKQQRGTRFTIVLPKEKLLKHADMEEVEP